MSDLNQHDLSGKGTLAGSFFAAVQFLTIVPPIIRRPFTFPEIGRSIASYPVVGLLIGALLSGINLVLVNLFPPTLRAVVVLGVWIGLTGVFHFDGWMDSIDGLFGSSAPEKRLEIMRDPRVGAYGVTAGILLIFLNVAALVELSDAALFLLLAPLLGRWGITLAVYLFPYGRKSGLGSAIKENVSSKHLGFATIVTLVLAILINWQVGLIGILVALAITLGAGWFTLKRIPGLTGDIYGAICILIESAVLVTGVMIAGK